MSSRRRRQLLLIAVLALIVIASAVAISRSPRPDPETTLASGGGPRPRAAAAGSSTSTSSDSAAAAPGKQSTPTPTLEAGAESASSPTPTSDDSAKTPQAAPLGLQAADEYRQQAQYPPWSRPLPADGEDPILRDREVSPISAAGPNGAEPILTVFPDQVGFEAPDAVTLYAFLTVAGTRVAAAEITGTITGEDLAPLATVVYRDDGAGGDPAAGDLIYTARFEPGPDLVPDLSDSFLVRVRALTTDQQERIAATGFLYSNPHAQLTGRYRDALVDGSLVIEAEVEVTRPGRFHLEATLYSEDGRRGVAEAHTAGELPAGRQWMRLTFFGRILAQSGVDGPYLLRFVALSTTTGMPNAKNRLVENAYVSDSYRAAQFSDAPFDDPDLLDAADRLRHDAQQ